MIDPLSIGALALKNWKLVAIGGLVVLLVTFWGYHRISILSWEGEVRKVEAELLVCRANVGTLEGALEASNAAVQRLREDALAKQAEADRRAQEARERASRDRKREAADDRSGPERMNAFMQSTFGE